MLGDQNQCQQSNAQRGATKLWNIATQQNVANNKIEAAAVLMYTCYHLGDSTSTCSVSLCVHRLRHQSEPAMLTLRPLYADAKSLVEASCACSGPLRLGLLCLGLLLKYLFVCWKRASSWKTPAFWLVKGPSAGRRQLHQCRHGA